MERFSKTISIIAFLALMIFVPVNDSFAAKKPSWWNKLQQLKVLESNRSDLEKLFKPFVITYERKFKNYVEIEYETKYGDLFVGYSLGKCLADSNGHGVDVEKDTLVMIDFTPKKPVKISTLSIDLSGFKAIKEEDSEVFYYRNNDLGIEYTIRYNKLENVSYTMPNSKEYLRCK